MALKHAKLDALGTVGRRAGTVREDAGSGSLPVVATSRDLRPGSVLVKVDVSLPETAAFKSNQYGRWKVLAEDGFAVKQILSSVGWHFFFLVPKISVSALSIRSGKAVRAALKKVFATVEAQDLNALEIVEIVRKRFLGVDYVRVVAEPRHVKDSPFFHDHDARHVPRDIWNFKGIFRRRAQIGLAQERI